MSAAAIDEAAIDRIVSHGETFDGTGNQGSIHIGTVGNRRVLVKAATGNLLIAFLQRILLRREFRAYQKLEGLVGIPQCFGLFRGRYLAIEYIDAPTYRQAPPTDRDKYFKRMLEIINSIHASGVVHGDLMRKSNILVGEGEYPYLIDFGLATIFKPGFHPLNHYLYNFLFHHDRNAWLKFKYQRKLQNMTPEDAQLYHPMWINRVARTIKKTTQKFRGRK